ncbi:hypothetical protein [Streptomyces sp. CS62]|uniref:hypothetical protein n=1 Tax=Streptomyces sp. CS62 TaxID=3119268 RepID=UPI002F932E6F
MGGDELWTTEEYGRSHEGRVGVLLADGTVPELVYFDGMSVSGSTVRHWSVYDGSDHPRRPQAHALRAECACGWTGRPRTVDWEAAGDLPFREYGSRTAERCLEDWAQHTTAVHQTTVPIPAELRAERGRGRDREARRGRARRRGQGRPRTGGHRRTHRPLARPPTPAPKTRRRSPQRSV